MRRIYYCRYFELREGIDYLDAPILNARGDLGDMGFDTFRGDNRTGIARCASRGSRSRP